MVTVEHVAKLVMKIDSVASLLGGEVLLGIKLPFSVAP